MTGVPTVFLMPIICNAVFISSIISAPSSLSIGTSVLPFISSPSSALSCLLCLSVAWSQHQRSSLETIPMSGNSSSTTSSYAHTIMSLLTKKWCTLFCNIAPSMSKKSSRACDHTLLPIGVPSRVISRDRSLQVCSAISYHSNYYLAWSQELCQGVRSHWRMAEE